MCRPCKTFQQGLLSSSQESCISPLIQNKGGQRTVNTLPPLFSCHKPIWKIFDPSVFFLQTPLKLEECKLYILPKLRELQSSLILILKASPIHILHASGIYDLWRSGPGVEDDNNKALWAAELPTRFPTFLLRKKQAQKERLETGVVYLGKTSQKKECLLSGIARIRGGRPLPEFFGPSFTK